MRNNTELGIITCVCWASLTTDNKISFVMELGFDSEDKREHCFEKLFNPRKFKSLRLAIDPILPSVDEEGKDEQN